MIHIEGDIGTLAAIDVGDEPVIDVQMVQDLLALQGKGEGQDDPSKGLTH
mgnify:CR=1 FL=1